MSASLTKKVVKTVARAAASPTLTRTATLVVDNDMSEPAHKRLKRDDTSATSILAGEESQLALQSIGTNVFIDEQPFQTLVETQSSTADVSTNTKTKGKRGGRVKKGSTSQISPVDFPPRSNLEWKIGAHVSAAGGVEESITNGAKIGFVISSMTFGDLIADVPIELTPLRYSLNHNASGHRKGLRMTISPTSNRGFRHLDSNNSTSCLTAAI